MKLKRGQISIFILFVAVIVLAAVIVQFVKTSSTEKIEAESVKTISNVGFSAPVKNYVENCLSLVSQEAIQILGWQGGHILIQEDFLITSYSILSYAYDLGHNTLPSISQMEGEISLYVDFALDSCLNNFTSFDGYEITTSDIETTTLIRQDSVVVTVDYPISVRTVDSTTTISDFTTIVPVRLGYLSNLLNNIVLEHQEDPGWIPVTYMSDLGLPINLYPYDENNIVYEIIDDQSLIDNEPYRFLFANRFEQ